MTFRATLLTLLLGAFIAATAAWTLRGRETLRTNPAREEVSRPPADGRDPLRVPLVNRRPVHDARTRVTVEPTPREPGAEHTREDPGSVIGLFDLVNSRALVYDFAVFAAAIDSIFEREVRLEGWAAPLEQEILLALRPLPAVVEAGGCKQSLCRFVLRRQRQESLTGRLDAVIDDLVRRLREGGQSMVVYIDSDEPRMDTIYFFSLTPQAPYAVELQEMLPMPPKGR